MERDFSFPDGFNGYNQIRVALDDQEKTTFTCPWGTYAYKVLPFWLCKSPTTFQRVVLTIFVDLIHDYVDVYMDDFTIYGNTFEEVLGNLKKTLKIFQESNPSLSNDFFLMVNEGVVLGNHVSLLGIKVDPHKFEVTINFPIPSSQRDVRSFLGHAWYYSCFIKKNSPFFKLLAKDIEFYWNSGFQSAFYVL